PTAQRWRPGLGIVVAAALLTAVAAGPCLPDLFGMGQRSPLVLLVSARPLITAGLLCAAVLAGLVTLLYRPAWPVPAGLAAVALVATAMVLPRAVPDPVPPTDGRVLTVVAFNTYEGNADLDELVDLI